MLRDPWLENQAEKRIIWRCLQKDVDRRPRSFEPRTSIDVSGPLGVNPFAPDVQKARVADIRSPRPRAGALNEFQEKF